MDGERYVATSAIINHALHKINMYLCRYIQIQLQLLKQKKIIADKIKKEYLEYSSYCTHSFYFWSMKIFDIIVSNPTYKYKTRKLSNSSYASTEKYEEKKEKSINLCFMGCKKSFNFEDNNSKPVCH